MSGDGVYLYNKLKQFRKIRQIPDKAFYFLFNTIKHFLHFYESNQCRNDIKFTEVQNDYKKFLYDIFNLLEQQTLNDRVIMTTIFCMDDF